MAVGSWQLAVGGWWLAVGRCELAVERRHVQVTSPNGTTTELKFRIWKKIQKKISDQKNFKIFFPKEKNLRHVSDVTGKVWKKFKIFRRKILGPNRNFF